MKLLPMVFQSPWLFLVLWNIKISELLWSNQKVYRKKNKKEPEWKPLHSTKKDKWRRARKWKIGKWGKVEKVKETEKEKIETTICKLYASSHVSLRYT